MTAKRIGKAEIAIVSAALGPGAGCFYVEVTRTPNAMP